MVMVRAASLGSGSGPLTHNVLFICHSQEIGGAEFYLERLIGHIATESSARVVCRPCAALDKWVQDVASIAKVTRLRLSRPGDLIQLWRQIRWASMVHLNLAFPVGKYQLLAAVACRLARRPMVCTHHLVCDVSELPLSLLARAIWARAVRAAYSRAAGHIVLSATGLRDLVSGYSFDSRRIDVIPNGVDLERFHQLGQRERLELRSRLLGDGVSPRVVACTVARLSSQKGLDMLIDAAAHIRRVSPALGLRFVVIGGGELQESLHERIKDLGLGETFKLLGPLEPPLVAQWLACADLFVLPSRFEGLPLALMEAMAAGLPVVATAVGGTSDLVTSSELGLLVPVDDSEALARAIRTLASDRELRDRMGARCSEKMQGYAWKECLTRTADVIAGAVAKPGLKQ